MHLFFVLLCLLTGLTASQRNDGVFYNPPQPGPDSDYSQNSIYPIGSTVQIRWSVSWDRISLTLYQNGNNDFEYLLPNVSNPNNYNWVVNTSKDFSAQSGNNGTVFFLAAYLPGTTTPFGSHYFNITNASTGGPLITTSATPSTSATATTAPVASTTLPPSSDKTTVVVTMSTDASAVSTSPGAISSPPPTTTAVDAPNQPNTGLSSTAKAGVGVGIGIGVPALVALGIFAGWMLRARNKPAETAPMSQTPHHTWAPLDILKSQKGPTAAHELPGRIEELAGQEPFHELPHTPSRRGSF